MNTKSMHAKMMAISRWNKKAREAQSRYAKKRYYTNSNAENTAFAVKGGKASARKRCGLSPHTIKYLDSEYQRTLLEENSYKSLLGGNAEVIHHYIPKSNMSVRWHRLNAIPLTHQQHMDIHNHPQLCITLDIQIKEIKGEEWYKELHDLARQQVFHIDKDEIKEYLNK